MIAPKHTPYPHILHGPASVFGMVSRQLLPHGRHRTSVCGKIWHEQSGGLDDRLGTTGIQNHLVRSSGLGSCSRSTSAQEEAYKRSVQFDTRPLRSRVASRVDDVNIKFVRFQLYDGRCRVTEHLSSAAHLSHRCERGWPSLMQLALLLLC
jgi:hypothetical protein